MFENHPTANSSLYGKPHIEMLQMTGAPRAVASGPREARVSRADTEDSSPARGVTGRGWEHEARGLRAALGRRPAHRCDGGCR